MSFSLSGIASGLDTNTIISQLMQLERIPYTKLETKKKDYNTELSVFRSINTKLAALRSAADDLRLNSNFNLTGVKSSDESVVKAVGSDGLQEGTFLIEVEQLATYTTLVSKGFNASGSELKNLGSVEFTINGETIQVDFTKETDEENLALLADAINKKSEAGVKASVIQTEPGKKSLLLTAKESGETTIELEDADFLGTPDTQTGNNAKFKLNGIQMESSTNEIKDFVSGLTITLFKENATATITIAKDVDKVAEKVEAFVQAYNDVINTIRTNTAKGAQLQGDSTLRSLQDQLYNLFTSGVGQDGEAGYQYLYQIGLEIDKGKLKGSEMTGTITFDKEKFKQALLDNPDAVYKLFAHDSATDEEDGIAQKFSNSLLVWTRSGSGILASRIDGYNNQISFITKQMEDMEVRLQKKEEQMKKQFNNMETALLSLQNQMSWLSGQLNSLAISTKA
jgi:flagellar hook-associated protein 2